MKLSNIFTCAVIAMTMFILSGSALAAGGETGGMPMTGPGGNRIPTASMDDWAGHGSIMSANGDIVEFEGRRFSLTGVQIVDLNGKVVSPSLIVKGAYVDVYMKGGRATKIIYHHGAIGG